MQHAPRCWPGWRAGEQIRDQLGNPVARRLYQLPRFVLRILCLEVREEFGIREVLQARSIVRHDVSFPWEVLQHMAVSVRALVFSCEDALFGGRPIRGDCLLVDSRVGQGVVHIGDYCPVGNRVSFCDGAHLREHAGVLQVTVGDSAVWVLL